MNYRLLAVAWPLDVRKRLTTAGINPATDKMNDLHLVSFMERRRLPLCPAHHSFVELDCDLLSFQIQISDEFRERHVFFDLSRFAVDLNKQLLANLSGQEE